MHDPCFTVRTTAFTKRGSTQSRRRFEQTIGQMITVKQQSPWSVRGVSRDARIRAKKAALHRGVTIGEWVSQALIVVADEERADERENLMPAGFGAREHGLLTPVKDKAAQEQQAPWSVRGVSRVARVEVAHAAARRRMTIGAWVDHAIITYADRQAGIEPSARRAPEPPREPSKELEKTMRLIEALAQRIEETQAPDTPAYDDRLKLAGEPVSRAESDRLKERSIEITKRLQDSKD